MSEAMGTGGELDDLSVVVQCDGREVPVVIRLPFGRPVGPVALKGHGVLAHKRTSATFDSLDGVRCGPVSPRWPSTVRSMATGRRHREAGPLGSMGRVASSVDNTMVESFWSTMQRELLDTRCWSSQEQLASAIVEWIDSWYNPRRRHTSPGMLSLHDDETLHTAVPAHKSQEESDFDHARGLKRDLIAHLGALEFVTARDNVTFLGPPGTGKPFGDRVAIRARQGTIR